MSAGIKFSKVQWKADVINNILDEKEKALVAAGFQLEGYIKKSFTSTKGGGKIHIPSAPGQPPAVDTGRLRASISTNWTDSGLNRGATGEFSTISDFSRAEAYKKNVEYWTKLKPGKEHTKKYKAKKTRISSIEDGVGSPGGNKSSFLRPGKFKVVVGTNVEYSAPLEFGTSRIAPRPFMRPAYDLFRNKIEKMLKRI